MCKVVVDLCVDVFAVASVYLVRYVSESQNGLQQKVTDCISKYPVLDPLYVQEGLTPLYTERPSDFSRLQISAMLENKIEDNQPSLKLPDLPVVFWTYSMTIDNYWTNQDIDGQLTSI